MSQVTLLIHLSIQLTINLWPLRTGPGRQTGAGAKVRRVWAALSAGQLGWKVKIYIWLIDNICLGLSWRVSITTPWMWWMFWCRREATKWRETPNRGRCQASITRMTSEKGSEDYTKNLTFFLSYILENAHNLRTSSTRVTKELAKSLIRKDSDLSNYHQK